MAIDLSAFSDEQLAKHLNTVINEQERRATLANVPAQIAELTQKFVDSGGDKTELDTTTA